MELYVLSRENLEILDICKISDYEINIDEETNAKSSFVLEKSNSLTKGNFLILNGLYKQFLFIIDDIQGEKEKKFVTVTCLDISNIFDRDVIEKNTEKMKTNSIEEFLEEQITNNFVNSDDDFLNINYIEISCETSTKGVVPTNAENGLYNFHTFLVNCRQYKNIYTEFEFQNKKLKISIKNKQESTKMVDVTLPEVTDYNKIYEEEVTAKVTAFVRETGSEYNLYLKNDRTTTTNKNDPNRAKRKNKSY